MAVVLSKRQLKMSRYIAWRTTMVYGDLAMRMKRKQRCCGVAKSDLP